MGACPAGDDDCADNPEMQAIIDAVAAYPSGTTTASVAIPFPSEIAGFYRYQGGLTTPTCNEVVTWTVFKNPVRISSTQAASIDAWNHHITHNNREVQALNGRTIHTFSSSIHTTVS